MKRIRYFLSKATTFCKSYVELCIWLLVFAVGIRFLEAILLSRINHDFASSIVWNLTGLCYDISLYLRISVWILIIFVAACFVSEKKTRIALRILQSLMLFLSLVCIVFFATSGFLLDKVVFSYSLKEIAVIIQSSSKSPVWVYIVVLALPTLYFFLSGKRMKINRILLIAFTVLTISSFFILNDLPLYASQYHVKTNKEYFLGKSIFSKFKKNDKSITEEDVIKITEEFRRYFPQNQFVEPEYPFLYKTECKDVLSPFFNLKPEPPNFVFVIVEGLWYDFFKNDYQLMPFLDSLSKKSLSWEHCLSVSARTFGILPALFGAAPLGEKGFMEQCPNNPAHHTLLRILHQNSYTNSFFYGGWVAFDNMNYFADQNNMSYLQDHDWDQDIINQQIGAYWGYEDHLTYLQALRELNRQESSPRIDVYLSLSAHDPWEYPRSSYFQDIVKNKVARNGTLLSSQKKKNILNSIQAYGCFAYADWAIRQLIEGYQQRTDFENTIFIITGDHSAFATQFGGYANYHVPLIIYSPMLKSGRNMKGVVSHRDITPTLLSLLQQNFNIETPEEVAWLNTALDTSLTFNANTFSPLQPSARALDGIVYKNYILCEGVLEELVDGVPRKINNPNILQQMNRLMFLYQALDLYVLNNDALIKNPHAHLNLTNVVLEIEDTIAQKSYYAKKSKLKVVKDPYEFKTALHIDTIKAFPLEFFCFKIPEDITELKVDIEFKYCVKEAKNKEGKVMNFILNVAKDGKSASYHWNYLNTDNQWNTYKNTTRYKKEIYASLGDDATISAYIWNPEKLEGYINDIKVTVTTDK